MSDDIQEQTMRFDDFEEDFDESRQLAGKYNVTRGSISYNHKSTDGSETGQGLWKNKNYQFETKEPSFYQDVLSTPQVERQVEDKINSAIMNSDTCAVCSKVVYAQEQVKAVRKVFHKGCLRCCSCRSTLQTNRVAEHGNDLYCQNCYEKTFGARKYGSVEKSISPESYDNISSYDNNNSHSYDEPAPALGLKPPSWNTKPRKSISDNHSTEQPKSRRVSAHQGPPAGAGNAEDTFKSVKDLLKPVKNKERCVSCTKPVYANELVKWNGKAFHKLCFKCTTCQKTLQLSDVVEFNKIVYCEHCHLKMRTRYPSDHVVPAEHVCEDLSFDNVDRISLDWNSNITTTKPRDFTKSRSAQPQFPYRQPIQQQQHHREPVATTSRFGNSSVKCAKCKGSVYAVEEVKAFDKSFHKICLRCNVCKKQLESNTVQEHDNEAYCKNCHTKYFGPTGYGIGRASVTNERQSMSPAFYSPRPVQHQHVQHQQSSSRSSSTLGPAKRFGGGANKCMRCNLTVYEMEKVVALKMPFHKSCYSCLSCKKTLSPKSCCESPEGEIYCNSCNPGSSGLGRAL